MECCRKLKTEALTNTLNGTWPRYRMNLETGEYEIDKNTAMYTGVIVGARADEEGSRSKERYFSPRDKNNDWISTISRRSSGISSRRTLHPKRMSESTRFLTGQN